MTDSFEITVFIPEVSVNQIYNAWMDSAEHSAFTGSPAQVDIDSQRRFTAWDGYISGRTLEVEPYHRILQSWRTTEFPESSPDSRLEILIKNEENGAQITLLHSNIPSGQGQNYRSGWEEYYFEPMQRYFSADQRSSKQE